MSSRWAYLYIKLVTWWHLQYGVVTYWHLFTVTSSHLVTSSYRVFWGHNCCEKPPRWNTIAGQNQHTPLEKGEVLFVCNYHLNMSEMNLGDMSLMSDAVATRSPEAIERLVFCSFVVALLFFTFFFSQHLHIPEPLGGFFSTLSYTQHSSLLKVIALELLLLLPLWVFFLFSHFFHGFVCRYSS